MTNVLDRLGWIIFLMIVGILFALVPTAVILNTSISPSCSAMNSSAESSLQSWPHSLLHILLLCQHLAPLALLLQADLLTGLTMQRVYVLCCKLASSHGCFVCWCTVIFRHGVGFSRHGWFMHNTARTMSYQW